jgi:hypothetical protein
MYTLQDYSDIIFTGYDYKLPENITTIIKNLVTDLGVTTSSENQSIDNSSENKYKKPGYFNKKKGFSRHENIDEVWEKNGKDFKATVIEKKEGIDKSINDVRICLNKISNKNYEMHRDTIVEYIENAFKKGEDTSDDDDKTEIGNKINDINTIANFIFDIASTNKFHSELYALLYKELTEKFLLFRERIDTVVEQYKDSIHKIKFVDANEDYDKFCDNNKLNDKRKALSTFIVNLMKKDVVDISTIANIVLYLQEIVSNNVDVDNMSYEIDEITENVFIFITMALSELKTHEKWSDILSNIKAFSQYKAKEHLSMSSRAIFKYMDILDQIKKSDR